MNNQIAGIGSRKPQLDIPTDIINLDHKNPRLVPYLKDSENASQFDLISVLYQNFDTEVIAMSMIANGYFDEEPIIVVPRNIPKEFSFSSYKDVDELTNALQKLIKKNSISFTVVEGNRRVATIKLLTNRQYREQLSIDGYYPKIAASSEEQLQKLLTDITNIPCIIYEDRKQITSYLGVRHIAGLLKWEAFAKAFYVAETIENEVKKGKTDLEAIQLVQKIIGDRSDSLKKQYITYKLFLEAKDDLQFDTKSIVEKFSLLTVIYNSTAIREYIGVPAYNKVDFSSRLVPTNKLEELQNVLTWVYGNEKTGEKPVLTDSRKITSTLSYVVASPPAVEYLKQFKDLEGAFERTNGEKEYLSKNLTKAFRAIQISLQFAYKYNKDEELLKQLSELEELIGVLKKNLS